MKCRFAARRTITLNYIGPEIGTSSGKATLTKGVVTGVQLETVLRELSKVQGYHRFDDLSIPFRAVATDLVTGKAVVFSEGELASVMRASMSVPGAVAPAEYGGMILVDGMLTSNLPVESARAMGADVIIAVNVGTPLLKREQLNSILGVAGQMLSILTEQNVQTSLASLKPTDILISPELGDFSTGDFDNLSITMPIGEAAARKVADRLAQLSLPPAEYAALRKRQQVAMAPSLQPVDEIRFNDLERVNPQAAQAVMETTVGQPLVQAQIDADMLRLYGTGDFEHVSYRILEEPGKRVMAVEAVEKAWGPNYLRLGIGLSSDFSGETYFNAIAGHRMTWLNSLGAELRTDLQVGFNNSLRMEFYQPLNVKGRYFVAPRVEFSQERVNLFRGQDQVAVYNVGSRLAAVDVGVQFGQYGMFRLGVEGGQLIPRLDTGPALIDPSDVTYARGAFKTSLVLRPARQRELPAPGVVGQRVGVQLDQQPRRRRHLRQMAGQRQRGPVFRREHGAILGPRGRKDRLRSVAGLRPDSVGRVPVAVGLRHRATGRREHAVRPVDGTTAGSCAVGSSTAPTAACRSKPATTPTPWCQATRAAC